MLLNEFNALIMEDGVQVQDQYVFELLHEHYMKSKSNKFDYVYGLMIVFKNWVWKNLSQLMFTDKDQLFAHFICHELGSYNF